MSTIYQPIVWNESLETGVPEIDDQHKVLVQALNDAAITLADGSNRHLLEKITQDLLSYALYHFETEDDLMQEYGYQDTENDAMNQHLEQHQSFTVKVIAVRDGLKLGNLVPADDILQFLNDWLVNHIQNTDMRLGRFILSKRNNA